MITDVHCHVIVPGMLSQAVPDRWRVRLTREAGQQVVTLAGQVLRSIVGEFTDPDLMLRQAAAQGVEQLVLSPWIKLVPAEADPAEAVDVCDTQNADLSALAAAWPGRISALGAVPIGDPELAAGYLRDLVKQPGIAGAEVPASVRGRYLGDDVFEPFWAAAADTGAVVFIHPTTTGLGLSALTEYYLWNSVGNPIETTIAAAQIAAAGVLDRYPDLKVVLAHGGGAITALRGRLRQANEVRAEARPRSPGGPFAALRRLHYDSLTHDPGVLAGLIDFVGPSQVLLGSDRPFDMGSSTPVDSVRSLGLDGAAEQQILAGNAERLLGTTVARAQAS